MIEYYIDGRLMPSPDSLKLSDNNLYMEGTGRDEIGAMHLDLIRPMVNQWTISYSVMEYRQMRTLRAALSPTGFTFSCLSPSGPATVRAYCGEFQSDVIAELPGNQVYVSCSFKITEM